MTETPSPLVWTARILDPMRAVSHRGGSGPSALGPPARGRVCLQCGLAASRAEAAVCRRCGLPLGAPPRPDAPLPSCPVCYQSSDDDGRFASRAEPGRRLALPDHVAEHDRFPVGDDEYLESLRRGDRIVIGRWSAPFELVRRYLVTGLVEGGRARSAAHNAIVTAMAQLARWGREAGLVADEPEWAEARAAISELMERYHRGRR